MEQERLVRIYRSELSIIPRRKSRVGWKAESPLYETCLIADQSSRSGPPDDCNAKSFGERTVAPGPEHRYRSSGANSVSMRGCHMSARGDWIRKGERGGKCAYAEMCFL